MQSVSTAQEIAVKPKGFRLRVKAESLEILVDDVAYFHLPVRSSVGIRAMLRRDSELDVVVLCLAAYVAELVMGWGHDILHFRHLWVVMAILMSFTSPRHVRVAARRRFEAQESEPTDRP